MSSSPAIENRSLVGAFKNKELAEIAYQELLFKGYSENEINVVMTSDTRDKYYPSGKRKPDVNMQHEAIHGAGEGAALGGAIGGIAGALAAVGAVLLFPGAGLLALGPLAAALAGAGAGGFTGGIIGALLGGDVPQDRVKLYELVIDNGGIILSVQPRNEHDAEMLIRNWKKLDAEVHYKD